MNPDGLYAQFDTFVMGRRTYECMFAMGEQNPLRKQPKESLIVFQPDAERRGPSEHHAGVGGRYWLRGRAQGPRGPGHLAHGRGPTGRALLESGRAGLGGGDHHAGRVGKGDADAGGDGPHAPRGIQVGHGGKSEAGRQRDLGVQVQRQKGDGVLLWRGVGVLLREAQRLGTDGLCITPGKHRCIWLEETKKESRMTGIRIFSCCRAACSSR